MKGGAFRWASIFHASGGVGSFTAHISILGYEPATHQLPMDGQYQGGIKCGCDRVRPVRPTKRYDVLCIPSILRRGRQCGQDRDEQQNQSACETVHGCLQRPGKKRLKHGLDRERHHRYPEGVLRHLCQCAGKLGMHPVWSHDDRAGIVDLPQLGIVRFTLTPQSNAKRVAGKAHACATENAETGGCPAMHSSKLQ